MVVHQNIVDLSVDTEIKEVLVVAQEDIGI